MRNKKIIILVLLLVVVAAAAWFFLLKGEEPPPRTQVLSKKIAIPAPGPAAPPPVKQAKVAPGTVPAAPGMKKAPAPPVPAAPKVKKAPAPAVPAATKPKPVKPAPTTKVVKSALSAKPFAINVSSFSTRGEADRLAAKISSSGYNSYVTRFFHKNQNWYRVRVGFYPTRAEAVKVRIALTDKFNTPGAWVVQPTLSEVAKHD